MIDLKTISTGINADTALLTGHFGDYGDATAAEMVAMNFRNARLPVEASFIMGGLPTPLKTTSDAASVLAATQRLDGIVASFIGAGLVVTLCPFFSRAIWAMPHHRDTISKAAAKLAARYAPTYGPESLMIELCNEPFCGADEWNLIAPAAYAAARLCAPKHTIVVPPSGHDVARNFAALKLIPDANTLYTMHHYQPAGITQQGAGIGVHVMPDYRYPKPDGSTDRSEWTRAKLESELKIGFDWAAANGVPIWLGEFGVSSGEAIFAVPDGAVLPDPESLKAWVTDVRAITEAHGAGWAYWGWDGRLFGLKPHGKMYNPMLRAALA